MAESQAPAQQTSPAPSKGFASSCAGLVAGNPYASLAVIVVLAILVIGLWVYYHGLFGLGPYATATKRTGAAASDDEADPETKQLIKTINTK